MKTHTQTRAELNQLAELIEPMSVAMLTTADGEGALVSRPMAPLEMDAEGALWFFTDRRSEKLDHLRTVNLAFCDADRGTYVSLCGRATIDTDRDRIHRLWTPMARPWFPEGPDSANLGLLKFVPETAEYWDAPHSKMLRLFAMAASVVASRPLGLGEHDTLTDLSPGTR